MLTKKNRIYNISDDDSKLNTLYGDKKWKTENICRYAVNISIPNWNTITKSIYRCKYITYSYCVDILYGP